ncbi:MAG: energy transducer TonB [Allopontixanthobacter sediminis]
MAYADQQMSGNRIIALISVGLIHVALGYALITGLAYEAVSKAIERVTTVDIEEPPPPEPEDEPPPPPEPDTAPPPPVAPPPPISIAVRPPQVQTQPTIPPPAPPALRIPPAPVGPPPPPPPPPPPRVQPKGAEPRGNPANWATANDYPSRALREEREGTTGFRVNVGADGRVTNCSITRSSGHPDLDEATCRNITRRARFRPATDGNGDPTTDTYSNAIRWVIPE